MAAAVPRRLPPRWTYRKLQDLATLVAAELPQAARTQDYIIYTPGAPVKRQRGWAASHRMVLLQEGDILWFETDIRVVPALHDGPAAAAPPFLVLRPAPDVHTDCLRWLLQSAIVPKAMRRVTGNNRQRASTRWQQIKGLQLPWPDTPRLQRQITQQIDAVLSDLNRAATVQEQTARDLGGVMAAAYREAFPPLPEGEYTPFHTAVRCEVGRTPAPASIHTTPRSWPLVTAENRFRSTPFSEWTSAPKVMCDPGDLVLGVSGGGAGQFLEPDSQQAVGSGLLLLSMGRELLDRRYVMHFVKSRAPGLFRVARGAAAPQIKRKLEASLIPLRRPDEQQQVALYLDDLEQQVRELERLSAQNMSLIGQARLALLTRFFEGD